jgi:hypothetical protein
MTVPSSGGLAVRQQATRQQLKATLLLSRRSSHEKSGLLTTAHCSYRTRPVMPTRPATPPIVVATV